MSVCVELNQLCAFALSLHHTLLIALWMKSVTVLSNWIAQTTRTTAHKFNVCDANSSAAATSQRSRLTHTKCPKMQSRLSMMTAAEKREERERRREKKRDEGKHTFVLADNKQRQLLLLHADANCDAGRTQNCLYLLLCQVQNYLKQLIFICFNMFN